MATVLVILTLLGAMALNTYRSRYLFGLCVYEDRGTLVISGMWGLAKRRISFRHIMHVERLSNFQAARRQAMWLYDPFTVVQGYSIFTASDVIELRDADGVTYLLNAGAFQVSPEALIAHLKGAKNPR